MNGVRRRAVPWLGLLFAACINGSYSRDSREEPIPHQRLETLQPGRDTLARCLDTLGAPNRVFEQERSAAGDSGMALLWFFEDRAGWGLEVTTPIKDASASFSYDSASASLPACMLWFGPDLVLQRWREGTLGELLPVRQRPPVSEGG